VCACGFGYGRACCSVLKRKLNGWRVEEKVRVCVDVTIVDRALLMYDKALLIAYRALLTQARALLI